MLSFYLAVIQDEKSASKFENIYYTYRQTMLNIAFAVTQNQHDAEDALSNALYAIAKNIEKIDDSNEILLKSYLFKVVKNAAIDAVRRRNNNVYANIEHIINLPSEHDVMTEVVGDEEYKSLVKTIYNMPSTYKDVLVLNLLHNLNSKEIASSLSMSVGTVKTKIRRGKKLLAEVLSEDEK